MSRAPGGHPLRGILLLMGAVLLFVLLDSAAKHLAARHPVSLLVWVRYLVHFLLMAVLLAPRLGWRLLATDRPGRQILRALCLLGTTAFGMLALQHMPLAETTAILFAAPLLVTLMAGPLLGERVSARRWLAVAVGFAGVLLIARPGSALAPAGVAFALAGAVVYALYQVMTRQLSGSESPVTLLFYTALVGSVAMTPLLPWQALSPLPPLPELLLMGALGILGGSGHFMLIQAFREAPASLLSPILYVQLVWAVLAGWLIFGQVPDAGALAGILTIGAAGVLMALEGRRGGSG